MLLKDVFNWSDPKLFSEESVIRRSLVFITVIIANLLIGIEAFGVTISDDLLRGYFAIDDNRKVWIGNTFLIGLAIPRPIFSYFATRYSTKRCFSSGLGIFLMGSLLGGCTTNYFVLLFFRLITGIGGGIIIAESILILKRIVSEQMYPCARQFNTNVFGLGFAMAVIVGGIIGQSLHWRVAFFLDAFLCAFAILLIWMFFKEKKPLVTPDKVDVLAYLYFLAFFVSFEVFFTQVKAPWNTLGWRSDFSYIWAFSTLFFLTLLIVRCLRSPTPLFVLSLLRNKTFLLICLANLLLGCAIYGASTMIVFTLIGPFQYEHITTGLVMSVFGFSLFLSGTLIFFIKHVKPIFFIMLGLLIIAISCFINHALTIQSEPKDVIFLLFLRGVGVGFCLQPMFNILPEVIPKERTLDAIKIMIVFRQFAGCTSSAILSTIVVMRSAYHNLRFGEQVNIQSSRFKYYVREFQLYGETHGSKNWHEAMERAKTYVIDNIKAQSQIASLDDAFFLLGWTCVVIVALMGLNELLVYTKKTYKFNYLEPVE